jgi:hypothetical protein
MGTTSLALALALLGVSGCFYTDEINEKPTPGIRVLDEGPYFVGDTVRFDATKSLDDQRSGLRTEWQAFRCTDDAPPICTPLRDDLSGNLDTVFAVDLDGHETVQVQLRVTDSLGATREQTDTYSIQVGNRLPSVEVQTSGHREGPGGPFILYRGINLIALPGGGASEFDGDGDEVSLDWQLLPPASSQSGDRSFDAVGDDGYRLVPDVPGEWGVIVTIDDGVGDPVEERKDFFVGEDKPPCLQGMEPDAIDDAYYLVDSVDGARRFSVLSVNDALDPFPASVDPDPVLGEAEFHWFLQEPGSADFVELTGYSAADYLVDPEVYNPGDRLALRVEVGDRVVGPERELACADEDWSCALDTGSGCFQRLTWGVDIR